MGNRQQDHLAAARKAAGSLRQLEQHALHHVTLTEGQLLKFCADFRAHMDLVMGVGDPGPLSRPTFEVITGGKL